MAHLSFNNRCWHFLLRFIQITITTGLIIVIFQSLEWQHVADLIDTIKWNLVILGMAFYLCSHLFNVARWKCLLHHQAPKYHSLLIFYGAGLFGNNFLPTGVGGDSFRIALLSREIPLSWAAASVMIDRIIGLFALCTLLPVVIYYGQSDLSINWNIDTVLTNQRYMLVAILTLCLICGATIVILLAFSRSRYIAWKNFSYVRNRLSNIPISGRAWVYTLAGSYGISIISHLCVAVTNWIMLRSIGIDVTFDASIWLMLATTLTLLVPITINGLGLREAVYVVVLSTYNIGATPALLAALLMRLALLAFALIGGISWLFANPMRNEPKIQESL